MLVSGKLKRKTKQHQREKKTTKKKQIRLLKRNDFVYDLSKQH